VLEGTFDHGEEGYGLWLDPAVQDDPVYAEHWAGHRPVTVTVEDDQIVVLGALPESELPQVSDEEREGAASGRIARFRHESRGERMLIAREAEERFQKNVTWGATLGGVTKRFTPGARFGEGPRPRWGWGRHGRWGWRGAPQQQGSETERQVF
jgi:hypothetical protein